MESLDNLILNEVKKRIAGNNSIVKISRMLMRAFKPITEMKLNIEQLTGKIARTQEQIQELYRIAARGQSTFEVDGLLNQLIERNERALDEKRKLESVKRLIPTLPSVAGVIKEYYDFCIRTLDNSTQQEKKVIIRNVIDKIVIDKDDNSARIHFLKVPAHIDAYLELLSLDLKNTFTCTVGVPRGRTGLLSQMIGP
jgi:hypothetical protein